MVSLVLRSSLAGRTCYPSQHAQETMTVTNPLFFLTNHHISLFTFFFFPPSTQRLVDLAFLPILNSRAATLLNTRCASTLFHSTATLATTDTTHSIAVSHTLLHLAQRHISMLEAKFSLLTSLPS